MGTELVNVSIAEGNDDFPPVPPGFETFSSFTIKKVEDVRNQDDRDMSRSASSASAASCSQTVQMETEPDISNTDKIKRSLRRRPSVNYGKYDDASEHEHDCALGQNLSANPCLPKGVIRGCPECNHCQKVTARWRPEGSCRPDIEDAPVFYPTEEEFEDTLKYIATIRPRAEQYGICRIVPPSSWKPPCPLKEKNIWENSRFCTRVQRVDKLQNRHSMKRIYKDNNHTRKRRRCLRMGVDCGPGDAGVFEAERFGFEPGPEFSLGQFQKYAYDFKSHYFGMNENGKGFGGNMTTPQKCWEPSVKDIEGEYWRMVEKPTEEIEVLYGADLETGTFGSGFPKSASQVTPSDEKYTKSGWNLNNFPRLSGSVLSYEESDISGVLVPWLYIGMCFSSFCWHVEDHHLYSLNYMHWGDPKMWYGVPGRDANKLELAMRKHLPDLFEEQPDLLHKLVTQLSPSILKSEGVPVYRCVQNPGEFVLTFPRAYHSGFNCGFNCAEAVNVAPVDWLPHGQIAIELYREQGRRTSISHDKLLLGAAREAVKAHWELNLLKKNTLDNLRWKDLCGKDGILTKALRVRVEMERVRREYLCNSSQASKMDRSFDATTERECAICLFDLHLSAAGCHRSPETYACLNHAKQLCSCAWNDKFFLFRYDINELNILVEAVEGKLSSIYRWAKLDFGLALSSYVSRDSLQIPVTTGSSSHSTGLTEAKQLKSQMPTVTGAQNIDAFKDTSVISKVLSVEKSPQQNINYLENLKDGKVSVAHDSAFGLQMVTSGCKSVTEKIVTASNLKMPVAPVSCRDTSNCAKLAKKDFTQKTPCVVKHENVIILSDDENDEPKNLCSDGALETSTKNLNVNERSEATTNKSVPAECNTKLILPVPPEDSRVIHRGDTSSLPVEQNSGPQDLRLVKEEYNEKCEASSPPSPSNATCNVVGSSGIRIDGNIHKVTIKREHCGHTMANPRNDLQHPQPSSCSSYSIEDKVKADAPSNLLDFTRHPTGGPSCSQNNFDKCLRQKGPRIAKVVRRINCNVEPLEYGIVVSGKLWCNSRAIFPKGFRSRVKYISASDPTSMCYYVSEILDNGQGRPLFMVSLENCPSEVFVHLTAGRCWEMVRDRVNQEITKQHKLGKKNLPPLQPPGTLDGFEMFGFTSPAIVQAIEAMDRNRVCTEYWGSRPFSRSQVQTPQHFHSESNNENLQTVGIGVNKPAPRNNDLPAGVDTILKGLIKKANSEELHSLYSILSDNSPTANRSLVTRLLEEEINKLPR